MGLNETMARLKKMDSKTLGAYYPPDVPKEKYAQCRTIWKWQGKCACRSCQWGHDPRCHAGLRRYNKKTGFVCFRPSPAQLERALSLLEQLKT